MKRILTSDSMPKRKENGMKNLIEDFKKFIKRGNVIDMAIGAVATAFTSIVNSFTKGIVSPLIALLTGESTLAEIKWVLRAAELAEDGTELQAEVAIMPGLILQAAIDFLIIATVLFFIMHIAHKISDRAKKLAEEIRLKTDGEYEKRLEKERADAAAAALAEKEAAERAAAETAEKEKEIERLRYREIELLEKIASLLENK